MPDPPAADPRSIECLNCGAPIPADAVDTEAGLARCAYCRSVYDLGAGRGEAGAGPRTPRHRPPVALPSGIQIRRRPGRLEIVRRWLSGGSVALAVGAAFWNGMLLRYYVAAATAETFSILRLIGPVFHVAVGVLLAYAALAGLLNRTRIAVTPGRILVRHAPIPWSGHGDVRTEQLVQLFCVGKKNGEGPYEVRAQLAFDHQRTLVLGLTSLDQALYLEQQIETELGIRDEPVTGEVPRGSG